MLMHSVVSELSCSIVIIYKTKGERAWPLPSWLTYSLPILQPFRVSHLTFYVQSVFCDIPLASNTDPWIYILKQHQQQQWTVTSPIHSKAQSPGTHVAVLALVGLEEPPTACGAPLSSIAKSNPLSRPVRLHKSLRGGNSIPVGFLIKDLQNPPQAPGPPLQGGDFCGIHSPPTWLYFSKSEDTAFTVHLCTNPPTCTTASPRWTPASSGPLWGSSHFQNGILHSIPLFLSVRTYKNLHRCWAHPCIPKLQKPCCQGFPVHLLKLLTRVDQFLLSIWSIRGELSRNGGPWGCPPWAIGCSRFTFCCITALAAKRGPTVS